MQAPEHQRPASAMLGAAIITMAPYLHAAGEV
jgi:hypothetical protein